MVSLNFKSLRRDTSKPCFSSLDTLDVIREVVPISNHWKVCICVWYCFLNWWHLLQIKVPCSAGASLCLIFKFLSSTLYFIFNYLMFLFIFLESLIFEICVFCSNPEKIVENFREFYPNISGRIFCVIQILCYLWNYNYIVCFSIKV